VCKADSFSATATLINWFRATPSDWATRRASSSKEPQVERRESISGAVDCSLEYHFIRRVFQLRPPKKAQCHRFAYHRHSVEDGIRFRNRQTRLSQLFRTRQHCLVLQHQRNGDQHPDPLIERRQQELTRSTPITP
jgi:hypothetical protein